MAASLLLQSLFHYTPSLSCENPVEICGEEVASGSKLSLCLKFPEVLHFHASLYSVLNNLLKNLTWIHLTHLMMAPSSFCALLHVSQCSLGGTCFYLDFKLDGFLTTSAPDRLNKSYHFLYYLGFFVRVGVTLLLAFYIRWKMSHHCLHTFIWKIVFITISFQQEGTSMCICMSWMMNWIHLSVKRMQFLCYFLCNYKCAHLLSETGAHHVKHRVGNLKSLFYLLKRSSSKESQPDYWKHTFMSSM